MNKHMPHRRSLLAPILTILAISMSGAAAADRADDVASARQESQILTTYALSPHLRIHNLQVSVLEGTATLTGDVDEGVNKELATQIALGVQGVKQVNNQIVIKSDYVPPPRPSSRTYGEVIDDATIAATIKSKLIWSRYTDGLSIEVESYAGKVTLRGTADSATASELATRLAANTRGVIFVENFLKVVASGPTLADNAKASAKEVKRDIADGWITTKVKSMLAYSNDVDSSGISVSTERGVVALNGKVRNGVEQAIATELALTVHGVKRVDASGLKH